MGLRDSAELDKMIQQFAQNQNVDVPSDFRTYSYDELMGLKFKLVNSADTYVYDDTYGIWKSKADDKDYMKQLVENGEDITIVGIVQPDYTASASMLTSGIAYPASLTEKVMKDAADSDIVKQQMADPATNVLTGESFGKAESLRDFDLTSLFSIDTNALKNAFSFDANALDFDLNGAFDLSSGSFDLSSLIDFSDLSLDIDELPDIDLSDAFAELDLSVSPEALQDLVQKVFKDYKKYIIGNGILNFKKWSFSAYLKSEQFQKLMAESMKDLVDPDKLQGQLSSALQTTIQTVMETYFRPNHRGAEKPAGRCHPEGHRHLPGPDTVPAQDGHPAEHRQAEQPDGERHQDRRVGLPEGHPAQHDRLRADRADALHPPLLFRHL